MAKKREEQPSARFDAPARDRLAVMSSHWLEIGKVKLKNGEKKNLKTGTQEDSANRGTVPYDAQLTSAPSLVHSSHQLAIYEGRFPRTPNVRLRFPGRVSLLLGNSQTARPLRAFLAANQ
jgi:hypothetical protein